MENSLKLSLIVGGDPATLVAEDVAGDRDRPPAERWAEGALINGRYRVERVLGGGGMGVVYAVHDALHPERRVALKTLRGALMRDRRLSWLRAEFRVMTGLRHPNVARVYDFEPVHNGGDHIFTLERFDGVDALAATEGKSWATVVEVLVQVCRALSYLHSRRVVHLDLKPGNVLVDADGRALVVDFGLVGASRDAAEQAILGTPAYISPEAVRREPLDHRADLYGLGILAYHLLCRRLPFESPDTATLFRMHCAEPLAFAPADQAALPSWLRSVVTRLCAKRPADRFPHANAVIEAINRHGGLAHAIETEETRQSYVFSSRLVGRERELEQLTETVAERTAAGRGAPLTIVEGPAGVGKSRLLRELRRAVQLERLPFIEAECYAEGEGEYAPIARAIEHLLTLAAAIGAPRLAQAHGQELAKLDPGLAARHGLTPSPPLSTAASERARLCAQIAELMVGLAEITPWVLAIENLHLAAPGTVEIIAALIARIDERERDGGRVRLALLASAREATRPAIGRLLEIGAARCVRLALSPLPPPRAGELLASILGHASLPAELVARIGTVTQGNPLFVEEVMRALVETGGITASADGWQAGRGAAGLEVPATVEAVFLARAALLDGAARRLLDQLAICGHPVASRVAQLGAGLDDRELQQALRVLTARQMIVESRGRQAPYRVRHEAMREALTAALGDARGDLHEAAARALEVVHGGDQLLSIAHHWNQAARSRPDAIRLERALETLRAAGRQERASGRLDAAAACFQEAIGLLSIDGTRGGGALEAGLHADLGATLLSTRGFAAEETRQAFERAHRLGASAGAGSSDFVVLFGLWMSHHARGRCRRSCDAGRQLLAVAEKNGDPDQILQAHHALWASLIYRPDLDAAAAHIAAGLRLYDPARHRRHAEEFGGHDPGACGHRFMAIVDWLRGRDEPALRSMHESLGLARAHPGTLANCLVYAAILHYLRREPRPALERAVEASELGLKHGLPMWSAAARIVAGWAQSCTGSANAGLREMREGLAAWRSTGAVVEASLYTTMLAEGCLELGAVDEGLAAIDAVLDDGGDPEAAHYFDSELLRLRGTLLARRGQHEAAREALRRAIAAASSHGMPPLAARAEETLRALAN